VVDRVRNNEERQKTAAIYFREVKALVLDRSATDLHLIEKYLASFGIPAELTESETRAAELISDLSAAEGKPFNLLILDYETPSDGGIEFFSGIKSGLPPSSELKVIMMVPLKREDVFQKIEEVGVDFGITKPIIPSLLYNGILEIFKAQTPDAEKARLLDAGSGSRQIKNSYRALVVEDNRTNQFIVREILEQAGFRVFLADNGEEGVNYYRDHRQEIDMILMDLHMPVLNGYEASALIRKMDPDIPIVAMTADAITGVDEECRRVGIDYYISKPFDPEKLTDTLLHILEPLQESVYAEQDPNGVAPLEEGGYEVLDISDGLKRIGNNAELFKMILREYMNEFQGVAEKLGQAIGAHNYHEAIQIVHKCKGGSGNVGAAKLAAIASDLQKSLTEEADERIGQLYGEFSITVKKLFIEARKYAGS
jgi:CheY-like chemotaxis protein/HPt (histidine-containing phosphotransfer) domain-containing protein